VAKRMKIVAFTSGSPYCSACREIEKLLQDLSKKYGDDLEIVHYIGEEAMSRLEANSLSFVPAIIINDNVIIEGVCPSIETVERALRGRKDEA